MAQPRPTIKNINAFPATTKGYKPLTADGAIIPLVYGRDTVNGYIFAHEILSTTLYVGVAWCIGEIFAVEKVYINDEAPPSGVEMRHYKGALDQGIDSWLAAAITGYEDDLVLVLQTGKVATAYTVFKIPTSTISGVPRFQAVINGKLILDPQATANTDPFYIWNVLDLDFESGGVDQSQYAHTVTLEGQASIDSGGLHLNSLDTEPVDDEVVGTTWTKVGNATLSSAAAADGTSLKIIADGDGLYSSGALIGEGVNFNFECEINAIAYDGTIGGADKNYIFSIANAVGDELEFYVKGHKLAMAYDGVETVGATTLATGTQIAVSLCLHGDSARMFIDGSQEGSTATWTTHAVQQERFVVGALDDGSFTSAFNGYIDEMRLQDFAMYYDGYKAPVAEGSVNDSGDDYLYAKTSLCHFDGADAATTTTDEFSRSWTFYSGAALSITQKKFGATSLSCLTADDILRTPRTYLAQDIFEINDATTLQGWLYITSLAAIRGVCGTVENPVTNNNGFEFKIATDGSVIFNGFDNTASAVIALTGTAGDVVVNTWHHWAVQRDATGDWKIFIGVPGTDGIVAASGAESGNITVGSTDFVLGAERYDVTGAHLNGYIDDFQAHPGVAMYGDEYTPPPAPLRITV